MVRPLPACAKLFGEEHQSTADCYYSLGITHRAVGDFKAALQSHQRALGIRIKLFGEEYWKNTKVLLTVTPYWG